MRLEQTGASSYDGVMKVGVGPVTAAEFAVRVTLLDQEPPVRFGMVVDGRSTLGFTRGSAQVTLSDAPDGTLMRYRAELQIGGRIAGVGQRLLDTAARLITRQGLEVLHRELVARRGRETPA
jgi:carbon monoxide dehydrogenase subunit G